MKYVILAAIVLFNLAVVAVLVRGIIFGYFNWEPVAMVLFWMFLCNLDGIARCHGCKGAG